VENHGPTRCKSNRRTTAARGAFSGRNRAACGSASPTSSHGLALFPAGVAVREQVHERRRARTAVTLWRPRTARPRSGDLPIAGLRRPAALVRGVLKARSPA
jgi:hypothetical protein